MGDGRVRPSACHEVYERAGTPSGARAGPPGDAAAGPGRGGLPAACRPVVRCGCGTVRVAVVVVCRVWFGTSGCAFGVAVRDVGGWSCLGTLAVAGARTDLAGHTGGGVSGVLGGGAPYVVRGFGGRVRVCRLIADGLLADGTHDGRSRVGGAGVGGDTSSSEGARSSDRGASLDGGTQPGDPGGDGAVVAVAVRVVGQPLPLLSPATSRNPRISGPNGL